MPPVRRSTDRRRRVLYQSHAQTPAVAGDRKDRSEEELRSARQPAKAFGSRVRQPLRGRWFSLVPVATFPMIGLATVLIAVPLLLTIAHHLAVTWPTLAYRPEIARPLRIDAADSFASWWRTMIISLSGGIVYLVYQLRRHRNDDYRGHYRLWRIALIALMLASVSSVVGLVSWGGALIEWVFGNRVALSGANWLRLLLDIAGIILSMRLVAEVRRCRPSMVLMLCSAALLGLAEATAWKLVEVESYWMSTIVIAAPMLAFSCFAVSCTFYLRLLYRQARNIPDEPAIRERLGAWLASLRQKDDEPILPLEELPAAIPAGAQLQVPIELDSWNGRRVRKRKSTKRSASEDPAKSTPAEAETPKHETAREQTDRPSKSRQEKPPPQKPSRTERQTIAQSTDSESSNEDTERKPKRRWFGLLGPQKPKPEAADHEAAETTAAENDVKKKRKRGFGLLPSRLKQAPPPEQDSSAETDSQQSSEEPVKAKRGLGSFFKRKAKETEPDFEAVEDDSPRRSSSGSRPQDTANQDRSQSNPSNQAIEDLDPDEIDWDSLSKSERRRLRKRMRRSGRAA